jgi:hypothetical protein
MIDLGNVHGQRTFYTAGRSLAELVEAGEVVAIPDPHEGIIYKRPDICTPLEMAAKLTVDEALRITEEWNSRL